MKKASKIFCLLAVSAFVTACNTIPKSPFVLSIDLSDAIALFNGNCCTIDEGTDFTLYKTDENGVTKRVAVKTKNSDDDKFFVENPIFTDFVEVSDEYFYAHIGKIVGDCGYFVSKKTGQAYKIDREVSFRAYDYWKDSTCTLRDFGKDKNGNIYGYAYDYKEKSDVLAKFTVTDKKVKYERIGNVPKISTFKTPFNGFAVDKDGNIAYRSVNGNGWAWNFYTSDKQVIPLKSKKAVWTGFDGEIYAYNDGNIEKLAYNKDKNEVEATVVRALPAIDSLNLVNMPLLYLNKTQKIFACSGKSNSNLYLYQIYGDNPVDLVYTPEEISNTYKRSYTYDYSEEGLNCDEDCIYATGYDGTSFTVNKIDTGKDMELTKVNYVAPYNDGVRFLNNKKMLLFWWGSGQNTDYKEVNGGAMSVSILDINTGTMSKQDKFFTGNSDRSSVVNLKTY